MKILLPVEGSECSQATLEWVADMYDKSTAEYHLLYVIPVMGEASAIEFSIVDSSRVLKKAAGYLASKGCKVVEHDYVLGDTVAEICRFAETADADIVVLGCHGRGGLGRLLLGSTSAGVLEHCSKPVVVYGNRGKKCPAANVESRQVVATQERA